MISSVAGFSTGIVFSAAPLRLLSGVTASGKYVTDDGLKLKFLGSSRGNKPLCSEVDLNRKHVRKVGYVNRLIRGTTTAFDAITTHVVPVRNQDRKIDIRSGNSRYHKPPILSSIFRSLLFSRQFTETSVKIKSSFAPWHFRP